MAPLTPPRSASSTTGSAYSHKHSYQSPPPKQPQHGDTPPVPAPPPPPQVVPGPNAFAQHRRAIGATQRNTSNDSNPGATSSPKQQYTVNMYSDMDPNVASPTFARQGSRLYRMHHRQTSSTDKSQAALGSASSGSAPWSGFQSSFDSPTPYKNQQAASSQFFERMRQARERLDTTIEESPQREEDAERMKLVPSPDPHSYPYPTHRAEHGKRNVERFRDLIANDALISPNTKIANIHDHAPVSNSHKDGKTSSNASTPKSQRSPKRGLLNKLGLGLRMNPPDENLQSANDYALISSVPPKAAKVLGAKSLPTRDRHAAAASSPNQWPSLEGVSRSPSAPSPKRSSKKGDNAQPLIQTTVEEEPAMHPAIVPSKCPLRRESRRVPKKQQELRYYDDENPPTPPSKPRPTRATEQQAEAGQREQPKDLQPEAQETSLRRAQSVQASPTPGSAPYTRSGFAGYRSAAGPVTNTPTSNVVSVYGSVAESPSSDKSPSVNQQTLSPNQQRHSYPDHSPSFKSRTSKRHSMTFLQPMKYDPKSPTAKAKWSVSHLPTTPASTTSRNSLKPGPLRLQAVAAKRRLSAQSTQGQGQVRLTTAQQKQQQHSSSGTGSSKSRDVSESTSASVPLFLETPDLSASAEGEETITATPKNEQVELGDWPGDCAVAQQEGDDGEGPKAEGEEEEEESNTITVEILHEYLVETWGQGETIKEVLQSQQDTLEDLREVITAVDNEVVEEVERLLQPMQQSVHSTNEGLVAAKRAQDEHAKERAKQHASTQEELTTVRTQLDSLNSEMTTLKSTLDMLTTYIHTHLPIKPAVAAAAAGPESNTAHTPNTTTTPQLSTSATTLNTPSSISAADFALMSMSQRSASRSPPKALKVQPDSRIYPAYERTPSPSKVAGASANAEKSWSSERERRTRPVGGLALADKHDFHQKAKTREGDVEVMTATPVASGATTAPSQGKGKEGTNTPSPRRTEAISSSSSGQSTATKMTGHGGEGRSSGSGGGSGGGVGVGGRGNGGGSFDIRNYLQSVPQSAQTDPGIRDGTWGRKVAREKFERWTG